MPSDINYCLSRKWLLLHHACKLLLNKLADERLLSDIKMLTSEPREIPLASSVATHYIYQHFAGPPYLPELTSCLTGHFEGQRVYYSESIWRIFFYWWPLLSITDRCLPNSAMPNFTTHIFHFHFRNPNLARRNHRSTPYCAIAIRRVGDSIPYSARLSPSYWSSYLP